MYLKISSTNNYHHYAFGELMGDFRQFLGLGFRAPLGLMLIISDLDYHETELIVAEKNKRRQYCGAANHRK